jgi:hypothetical protein
MLLNPAAARRVVKHAIKRSRVGVDRLGRRGDNEHPIDPLGQTKRSSVTLRTFLAGFHVDKVQHARGLLTAAGDAAA